MLIRNFPRLALVCLAASAAALAQQNQGNEYLFQFANQPNTFTQFSAFLANANPLSPIVNGTGPSGIAAIIPAPNGNKFYLIGSGGPTSIQSADGSLANFHSINGLGLAPTAATVSLDGKYFLVAADGLYIIDTSSDQILTPGGLPLPGAATFSADQQPGYCASCWIVVSPDSLYAFVLTNSAFGSQVTAFNLNTRQRVGLQLNLTGDATSITMTPDGTIYVGATNRLFSFAYTLLTSAQNGSTQTCDQVNQFQAVPPCVQTALAFEPSQFRIDSQGLYAYAANKTPQIAGQSLIQINLKTGAITTWPGQATNNPIRFSDVFLAANNRLFAYAPDITTLFDVSSSPFTATLDAPSLSLPRVTIENVIAVAVSNEVPTAHWLFLLVANGNQTNLYRIDLTTNTVNQQTLSTFNGGVMQVASVPVQTGAAQFIKFNDAQQLQNGATSAPLIARVLDANGNAVFNAAATFSIDSSTGVVINNPSPVTNVNGFVQTTVKIPSTGATCPAGICTITLTVGGANIAFTVNAPNANGGGGGGGGGNPGSSQVTIVSGDGQLVPSGFALPATIQPLTVKVTDTKGKPLPNVQVTYNVNSNTVNTVSLDSTTATTDQNGLASVNLRPSAVSPNQAFFPSTVLASTQYGSVTFTETIFVTTALGGADIPQTLVLTPDAGTPIKVSAGTPLANGIVAQVYSQTSLCPGCPIPGVGISIVDPSNLANDPNGAQPPISCQGSTLSDANGLAHCTVVAKSCQTGSFPVTILVGGLGQHDAQVQITQGTASSIALVTGNNQKGSPGQTLATPLVAQITNGCGVPVSGVAVTWAVTQGSATLKNTINTSDVNGTVSTSLTFGQSPGPLTVTVTVANGGPNVKFQLTNQVLLNSLSLVSGGNQNAVTGQQFAQPVVFLAKDAAGNPVSGVAVTFAVTTGSANVNPASVNTDAQGHASVTVTAGNTAGAIVVTASAGGFAAVANLTAIPPGPSLSANSFTNTASGAIGLVACGLANATGNGLAAAVQGVISASLFGPLPFSLGPISSLTVNSVQAPISSVSNQNGSQQVTFQVPCEVSPGAATVVITINGNATTISGVQVLAAQPGIFTYAGPNNKPYAAVIRAKDGTYVTPASPMHRNETYFVILTGMGQTTPPASTDNPGNGQTTVAGAIVGVNNQGVPVVSSTYLGGAIGVYIIGFQVPDPVAAPGIPNGNDVPFSVGAVLGNQVIYSNSVFVPGVVNP